MMETGQIPPPEPETAAEAAPVIDMRARIVAATARLIVTDGLEFPVSRVARESGVAVGSIYNHFPSKHHLIVGVYQQIADQIVPALTAVPPAADTTAARLMAYIHAYIEFFRADPDRATLFEYLSNAPLIAAPDVAEIFKALRSYNSSLFAEGQAQGILKPMSPRAMAGFVGGGIRNALRWHRIENRSLTDAARNDIARMCWSAIALDPGAPPPD
jgi:AcrR family transcriptional regulator